MKTLDLIATANTSLLRNKGRTVLTIIAIVIGATTLSLTTGIGSGIKSYLNQQLGNLGATNVLFITLTGPKTSLTSGPAKYTYNPNASVSSGGGPGQTQLLMNPKDIAVIKAIPGIAGATADFSPTADYIQGNADKYQVTFEEQFGNTTAVMLAGAGVNDNSSSNQVSIPESYVSPLGYSSNQAVIGKTVTLGITNAYNVQSTVAATVTGVQQKNLLGESTLSANTALVNQANTVQDVGIPSELANTFQTADATFPANYTTAQISAIKARLTTAGFSSKTIKDEESTIFTAINAITYVFDAFAGITLVAAAFGIVNTLFMSVQERTKEIGLMKALGMSKRKIFALFSLEAILIGFWGSMLGVGLAELIGKLVNTIATRGFLKDFTGLHLLSFPLKSIAIIVIGIMLIAFLAGTLPARRASQKDPIEALRYE